MSYTPQDRHKFYTWFVECDRNYKDFAIRIRRKLRIHAKVPPRNSVLGWSKKLVETKMYELFYKHHRSHRHLKREQRRLQKSASMGPSRLNDITANNIEEILTNSIKKAYDGVKSVESYLQKQTSFKNKRDVLENIGKSIQETLKNEFGIDCDAYVSDEPFTYQSRAKKDEKYKSNQNDDAKKNDKKSDETTKVAQNVASKIVNESVREACNLTKKSEDENKKKLNEEVCNGDQIQQFIDKKMLEFSNNMSQIPWNDYANNLINGFNQAMAPLTQQPQKQQEKSKNESVKEINEITKKFNQLIPPQDPKIEELQNEQQELQQQDLQQKQQQELQQQILQQKQHQELQQTQKLPQIQELIQQQLKQQQIQQQINEKQKQQIMQDALNQQQLIQQQIRQQQVIREQQYRQQYQQQQSYYPMRWSNPPNYPQQQYYMRSSYSVPYQQQQQQQSLYPNLHYQQQQQIQQQHSYGYSGVQQNSMQPPMLQQQQPNFANLFNQPTPPQPNPIKLNQERYEAYKSEYKKYLFPRYLINSNNKIKLTDDEGLSADDFIYIRNGDLKSETEFQDYAKLHFTDPQLIPSYERLTNPRIIAEIMEMKGIQPSAETHRILKNVLTKMNENLFEHIRFYKMDALNSVDLSAEAAVNRIEKTEKIVDTIINDSIYNPVKCDICSLSLSTVGNLKIHKLLHKSDFSKQPSTSPQQFNYETKFLEEDTKNNKKNEMPTNINQDSNTVDDLVIMDIPKVVVEEEKNNKKIEEIVEIVETKKNVIYGIENEDDLIIISDAEDDENLSETDSWIHEGQLNKDGDDDEIDEKNYKEICDLFEKQKEQKNFNDGEITSLNDELKKVVLKKVMEQEKVDKKFDKISQQIFENTPSTSQKNPNDNNLKNQQIDLQKTNSNPPQQTQSKINDFFNKKNDNEKKFEIICCAGSGILEQPPQPHNPHFPGIHMNENVRKAVEQLEEMGYDNCNGWLTKIAEERGGDVSLVLDAMSNDPIYVKKMRLHGLI